MDPYIQKHLKEFNTLLELYFIKKKVLRVIENNLPTLVCKQYKPGYCLYENLIIHIKNKKAVLKLEKNIEKVLDIDDMKKCKELNIDF